MRLDSFGACAATAALVLACACSKKPAEPPPAATSAPSIAEAVPAAQGATADGARVHGLRKLLNVDVPVLVDGKQAGVLRYGELPPGAEPITIPSNSHHAVRYYRVSDYLRGIGVDVAKVKAVHFADKSDRVASLEGEELRRDEDRFVFDFTATTAGMPQMAWKTVGLKTMLRIDYFYAVNVFVTKKPWEIDRRHHCYLEDDGECRPVARFAEGDLAKGTRVYEDGRLVGFVKRRLVPDDAIVGRGDDDELVVSADKYLAAIGVATRGVRRVELLSGDSLVASATADEWAADAGKLTLRVVRHAHGKVRANVPADLQAKRADARDREAPVTAIAVFRRRDPRPMPLVAIDEGIDLEARAQGAVAEIAKDEDPQD